MKAGPRPIRPKRKIVKVAFTEEELEALDSLACDLCRTRSGVIRILVMESVDSCRDYGLIVRARDSKRAVQEAGDFFLGLHATALEAQRTLSTVSHAASDGADRCRQWLEVEKIRRAAQVASPSEESKVVKGKFPPAPEAAS